MGPTTGPTFAQVWVQLSYEDGVVTMVTNLNFSCGMLTDASFAYHLRSLRIRHFRVVAVTELKSKNVASSSPSMVLPPFRVL